MTSQKLSSVNILSYGFVATPLAALYFPVYIFLAEFYAKEYNLSLFGIGLVFIIVRLFDAFSDPIVGFISDRAMYWFRSRKPWLLIGAPLVMLSTWYLFYPSTEQDIEVTYLFVWLFLLTTGWTIVLTPYFSLGAEISSDYSERSRITLVREALALIGTVFAAILYARAENSAEGLKNIAIFVVIMLPIAVIMCSIFTREIKFLALTSISLKDSVFSLIEAFKCEPLFSKLLIAYFINGAANALPAALFLFYVNHKLGASEYGGILLLIYFCSAILATPLWIYLSNRMAKHKLWCYSMIYASAIFISTLFFGNGDWALFLIVCVLSGFALSADLAIPASIQADLIDLEVLRSGSRRTGAFFSVWSVATKGAVAISSGLGLMLLAWTGLNNSNENSELSLFLLSLLYGFIPVLLKLIAIGIMWNFQLNFGEYEKIRRAIKERGDVKNN